MMEERGKHKENHSEGETSTSKTREKRGEESVVELKDEDWEKVKNKKKRNKVCRHVFLHQFSRSVRLEAVLEDFWKIWKS